MELFKIKIDGQWVEVPAIKGETGAQGPTGKTGPAGEKGTKGDTGAMGPTGKEGPTGATGAKGAKGDKGEKGDTGVQGPTGKNGAQGPTGATGVQGPTGERGAQGPTGKEGAIGPTGETGAKGSKGDKGDPGVQGPTGATGPTGAKGEKGDKGDTGVQGPTGEPGAMGPTGATGPTGASADLEMPVEITQGSDTMLTLTTRDGYPTFIVKNVGDRYVVRFWGDNEQEFGSFNTPDGWVGNAQLTGNNRSHYDQSFNGDDNDGNTIANINTVRNVFDYRLGQPVDTLGDYAYLYNVANPTVNVTVGPFLQDGTRFHSDSDSSMASVYSIFKPGYNYTITISYNNGSSFTVSKGFDYADALSAGMGTLNWDPYFEGNIEPSGNVNLWIDETQVTSVESFTIYGTPIVKTRSWQQLQPMRVNQYIDETFTGYVDVRPDFQRFVTSQKASFAGARNDFVPGTNYNVVMEYNNGSTFTGTANLSVGSTSLQFSSELNNKTIQFYFDESVGSPTLVRGQAIEDITSIESVKITGYVNRTVKAIF